MSRMRGHIGAKPTAHCTVKGHGNLGKGVMCEVNDEIQGQRIERSQEKREAEREINESLGRNP